MGGQNRIYQPKRFLQLRWRREEEQCLCYYCDDKYSPTHQCLKGKVFLMEGCELMHGDQIFSSKIDCDDSGLELQIQEEVGEIQQPENIHACYYGLS